MSVTIDEIDSRIRELVRYRQEIAALVQRYGGTIDEPNFGDTSLRDYMLNKEQLKALKVAAIMDRFSLDSYSPECNLLQLTPDHWLEEINSFAPDLIFIESAWQGKDGLWYRKIANSSKEYFEMTSYCHSKNIPVIFWNKEDPVYTDTFMAAARMADFVFTTDIDCIKRYKTELGHNFVYHLHFAAQPRIHNPIEKFDRKDKFCFAGAYYHRYQNRAKIFDLFSEIFVDTKGLDIFDRNYGNARPEHAFPKQYNRYILGNLDPSEIDKAYKAYNYGVNMNSIDQSQTMFARRVFELLASNTVTVGNYSRGQKNYFGDLTICTEDPITLSGELEKYCHGGTTFRKYRLLGLRTVLSEHLYEDRLGYVVEKVFRTELKPKFPLITVVAHATAEAEIDRILINYERQTYQNKYLILVTDIPYSPKRQDIRIISVNDAKKEKVITVVTGYFASFHSQDYYGANYLLDLALTTRYGNFSSIGKASFYIIIDGETKLSSDDTYRYVPLMKTRRSIVRPETLNELSLYTYALAEYEIDHENMFSVDEFNYCENCLNICREADDLKIADQGIALKNIEILAEQIEPNTADVNSLILDATMISSLISSKQHEAVSFDLSNDKLAIQSSLGDDQHQYFYLGKLFELNEFKKNGKLPVVFSGSGDLDLTCVCVFYDLKQRQVLPVFPRVNTLSNLEIPDQAFYFKLGFRPKGKGEYNINRITIGEDNAGNERGCFLSRSNVLVLSNQYPAPNELYRNMFVHKRMTSYKEEGYVFDIMKINIYAQNSFKEFEGINVVEGQGDVLNDILDHGIIDTVCVHFLDSLMWSVLKNYTSRIKIISWMHGSESQPWWRREFNYNNKEETEKAKKESDERMKFWKEIFLNIDKYNMHFVFVSQYFANEVFEDYEIELPPSAYTIIHNCIDTDMFAYRIKDIEQRKRILSIRPYASNKYANDLTTECILELSKRKYFSDLEFLLIGNGSLFDSTVKPLKKFKNVTLRKTFLRQDEIAGLYKQYGVFLTPTRWDSQGVSRDEAMSSGLVPITNAVAAIPEFVDEKCGILAPAEDHKAMAEGIERMYGDPEYFLELSKSAAKRVCTQSVREFTIDKELSLINLLTVGYKKSGTKSFGGSSSENIISE